MTPNAVDRCARLLLGVRRDGRLLAELPADCRPGNVAEGYAVQNRLAEIMDVEFGGWFLGCTNPEIQRQLDTNEPYSARLIASEIYASPKVLQIPSGLPVVLEVEFAFRLSRDLPPRETSYSVEEASQAIASVHPSIEVVISHFEDWTYQSFFALLADNGTDGALVYGKGSENWRELDLAHVRTRLVVNDEPVVEGGAANIDGGPLGTFTWLANHLSSRNIGLRAGEICNTGSCTSMYFVERGSVAVAQFDGLGEVTVELPA